MPRIIKEVRVQISVSFVSPLLKQFRINYGRTYGRTSNAHIVDLRDKIQPTRAEIALMKHHIKHGAHRQKYGKS